MPSKKKKWKAAYKEVYSCLMDRDAILALCVRRFGAKAMDEISDSYYAPRRAARDALAQLGEDPSVEEITKAVLGRMPPISVEAKAAISHIVTAMVDGPGACSCDKCKAARAENQKRAN